MFKRFMLLTIFIVLLASAAPSVMSQADCNFSYSNYARAVQLHDMGDYTRALRHYDCALLEDPDSEIIPKMIETLHKDSVEASSAWSSADEETAALEPCPESGYKQRFGEEVEAGDVKTAMHILMCAVWFDDNKAWALRVFGHLFLNRGLERQANFTFEWADEVEAAVAAKAEPQQFQMPDWLKPYETAPRRRAVR